jgi:beta-barrel assembly-enhancing protease
MLLAFRKSSTAFRVLCVVLTAALLTSAAKEKVVGGGLNFFPLQTEIEMGRKYSDELNAKLNLVNDPVVTAYVRETGNRLVQNSLRRDLEYHFFVVNTREVNAFALPGGFVYVNRGLIETATTDSELAGVIGHEIGHVVGRHSLKQMSKQLLFFGIVAGAGALVSLKSERWASLTAALGGIGVFFAGLKYSRDDEREADRLGLYEMAQAGFDPSGMVSFFQKLDELSKGKGGRGPAFFSTHPLPAERVRNMQAEIEKAKVAVRPRAPENITFQACRSKLGTVVLPPPSQEKPLGQAIASLQSGAGFENTAVATGTGTSNRLNVPGNTVWLDTGLDLAAGQAIEIKASGTLFYKKNSDESCDPWGIPGANKGFFKPMPKINTGALVGRIGAASETTFAIGAHRLVKTPAAGRLFLGINDDNNFDNRGNFDAEIIVYR